MSFLQKVFTIGASKEVCVAYKDEMVDMYIRDIEKQSIEDITLFTLIDLECDKERIGEYLSTGGGVTEHFMITSEGSDINLFTWASYYGKKMELSYWEFCSLLDVMRAMIQKQFWTMEFVEEKMETIAPTVKIEQRDDDVERTILSDEDDRWEISTHILFLMYHQSEEIIALVNGKCAGGDTENFEVGKSVNGKKIVLQYVEDRCEFRLTEREFYDLMRLEPEISDYYILIEDTLPKLIEVQAQYERNQFKCCFNIPFKKNQEDQANLCRKLFDELKQSH